MANQIQTFLTQLGLAKETTWATAITPPTASLAMKNPVFEDKYVPLIDQGYRGLPSMDFAWYQGVKQSTGKFDAPFYPDDSGHLLMGILGNDAITGTTPPYTHAIALASAKPPSYTFHDLTNLTSGGNIRQYAGNYFEQVDLKWVANGELAMSASLQGKASTSVAKPVYPAYSVTNIFLPWQGALTLNAASNTNLIDLNLSIKRKLEPVFGSQGTQDLVYLVPGRVEVTGTAIFAPVDETELLLYINNTQGAFSLLLTSGANTLTIQMTKCAFESPTTVQRTKEYVEISAGFRAVSNATDVSSGGATAGPIKFSLLNTRSTAY